MNNRNKLISYIRKHSFQWSDEPVFKLTSGGMSNYYFNLKKTTYSPVGQYLIGKLLYNEIQKHNLKPKAIGGLTLGADPIASAVAFYSYNEKNRISAFVIRKEPKKHGAMLQVEGDVSPGDDVIIIDDVVTTGQSTIKAIEIARKEGLNIICVIVLLDRCEQNGRENIEKLGFPVFPFLTIRDFSEKK